MTPSDTAKNPDAGSVADTAPMDQQKAQDLADKVMRDLNSASRYRISSDMGPWRIAVFVLSVALTLFQLYTAIFGTLLAGTTPQKAALWGILVAFVISLLRASTRLGVKDTILLLEEGAKTALPVIAACATAGMVAGIVTATGLGGRLADGILTAAGVPRGLRGFGHRRIEPAHVHPRLRNSTVGHGGTIGSRCRVLLPQTRTLGVGHFGICRSSLGLPGGCRVAHRFGGCDHPGHLPARR